MPLKTSPFDPVEYLKTEAHVTAYLNAAFEDGDPAGIAAALGNAARARGVMAKVSASSGMSRGSLYKSLSKNGNPGIGTVVKVAKSLGYSLAVVPDASAKVKKQPAAKRSKAKAA